MALVCKAQHFLDCWQYLWKLCSLDETSKSGGWYLSWGWWMEHSSCFLANIFKYFGNFFGCLPPWLAFPSAIAALLYSSVKQINILFYYWFDDYYSSTDCLLSDPCQNSLRNYLQKQACALLQKWIFIHKSFSFFIGVLSSCLTKHLQVVLLAPTLHPNSWLASNVVFDSKLSQSISSRNCSWLLKP